ncbi:hypothetical protein I5Q45_23045 [Serratia marcescens]|nr:hypothetical protein [Serratia marcescens]
MINKNINTLHCVGIGRIIDEITADLQSAGLSFKRGPRCFAVNPPEFVDIIIPATTAGLSVLAGILVAYINRNRRVKVAFHEGYPLKEIEAPNSKELMKLLHEIKALDLRETPSMVLPPTKKS